jgi:GNAT superfamily N-acetyltransferase
VIGTQIGRGPSPGGTEIRRADSVGLAELGEFFAGLSARTRALRFFAPVMPSSAMLRCLSGSSGTTDALIAVRGGVIVGHAMAVDLAGPRGTVLADVGVVVADTWQHRGVGAALMRALIARAQARGVTSFSMDLLPSNYLVRDLVARHWPSARAEHSADCITVQVRLPQPRRARPLARPGYPRAARRQALPLPAGRCRLGSVYARFG